MARNRSVFGSRTARNIAVVAVAGIALSLGGFASAQAAIPTVTLPGAGGTATVQLGSADDFAVLAATTVTNTSVLTVIKGDLGVSPGTAVTGFPPGTVENGSIHSADAQAGSAQTDATTAYNDAESRTGGQSVGPELGGMTLTPGVYTGGTFEITGTLTLSGDATSVFIFQAASTLVTASYSHVALTGGVLAKNVFWQVGSSATLGTYTDFTGTVLALTSIQAQTGTSVSGRLLALNGAVTLDAAPVTKPSAA